MPNLNDLNAPTKAGGPKQLFLYYVVSTMFTYGLFATEQTFAQGMSMTYLFTNEGRRAALGNQAQVLSSVHPNDGRRLRPHPTHRCEVVVTENMDRGVDTNYLKFQICVNSIHWIPTFLLLVVVV